MKLDWFDVAKQLKDISQAGKCFAKDEYELERHLRLEKIAAEMLACCSGAGVSEVQAVFHSDTGYPTPKVDSRAVVFRDDKVLLVKERSDGLWTFPGGWCDSGSTPSQNVERELFEESGFVGKAQRLLAVYDRDTQGHKPPYPFSIYKMFFLCTIISGSPTVSNETSEVEFFSLDSIPPLSEGRTLGKQIELFAQMRSEPNAPTVFD